MWYTESINHEIDLACRGHYSELKELGFAEEAFL